MQRFPFLLIAVLGLSVMGGMATLLWPTQADVMLMQFRSGALSSAEKILRRGVGAPPAEEAYLQAGFHDLRGEVEQSASILKKYLQDHPNDVAARREYWRMLKESMQYKTYLRELEQHYFRLKTKAYKQDALMLFDRLGYLEREQRFLEKIHEKGKLETADFRRLFWLTLRAQERKKAFTLLTGYSVPNISEWDAEWFRWAMELHLRLGHEEQAIDLANTYIQRFKTIEKRQALRREVAFLSDDAGDLETGIRLLKAEYPAAKVPVEVTLLAAQMRFSHPQEPNPELRTLADLYRRGRLPIPFQAATIEMLISEKKNLAAIAEGGISSLPTHQWLAFLTAVFEQAYADRLALVSFLEQDKSTASILPLLRNKTVPENIPASFPNGKSQIVWVMQLLKNERIADAKTLLQKVSVEDYGKATDDVGLLYLRVGLFEQANQLLHRSGTLTQAKKNWLEALIAYEKSGVITPFLRTAPLTAETVSYWEVLFQHRRLQRSSTDALAEVLLNKMEDLKAQHTPAAEVLFIRAAMAVNKPEQALPLLRQKAVDGTLSESLRYVYAEALDKTADYAALATVSRQGRASARDAKTRQEWSTLYWKALANSGQTDLLRQEWRAETANLDTTETILPQAYWIDGLGFPDEAAQLLMRLEAPAVEAKEPAIEYLLSLKLSSPTALIRQKWLKKQASQAPRTAQFGWLKQLLYAQQYDDLVEVLTATRTLKEPAYAVLLAETLYKKQDNNALAVLLRDHLQTPFALATQKRLANYAVWAKLNDAANLYYRRILEQEPDFTVARLFLAEEAFLAEDYERVLTWLEPVAAKGVLPLVSMAEYAKALRETGAEVEAKAVYRHLARRLSEQNTHDDPKHLEFLASAQLESGDIDAAILTYYKVLWQKPDSKGTRANLIQLLLDKGRMTEAEGIRSGGDTAILEAQNRH
jgi:hypothetical protein